MSQSKIVSSLWIVSDLARDLGEVVCLWAVPCEGAVEDEEDGAVRGALEQHEQAHGREGHLHKQRGRRHEGTVRRSGVSWGTWFVES